MPRITEELLRSKSEHNDGLLCELEEISLHQLDIEKIENLDKLCRDVQILYLQNNLIGKIENCSRLRALKYLNLAVNNIQKIEGLEKCEFLEKLDFTVNFIDAEGLLSFESLKELSHLRELYVVGNPCTNIDGFREFLVGTLPQLSSIDGTAVTPSERISCAQQLPKIRQRIATLAEQERRKRENHPQPQCKSVDEMMEMDDEDLLAEEQIAVAYTPQSRLADARRAQARKEKKEKEERDKEEQRKNEMNGGPPKPAPVDENGTIRQKNEGGWAFHISEVDVKGNLYVDIGFPKFLDTSLIDLDVQPTHVRAVAKGKVFQILLPEEVHADKAVAERSQTTGHLLVTLPVCRSVLRPVAYDEPPAAKPLTKPRKEEDGRTKRFSPKKSTASEDLEAWVDSGNPAEKLDYSNIVRGNKSTAAPAKTASASPAPRKALTEEDTKPVFVDDDEVPPLE